MRFISMLLLSCMLGTSAVHAQSFPDNLPTSHPRVWWTPERLARARQLFAQYPFDPRDDALANAFVSLMTDDPDYAAQCRQRAIDYLLQWNDPGLMSSDQFRWQGDACAWIFDWLYDYLTDDQRAAIIDAWNGYVDHYNHQDWGNVGFESNNYYWGFLRNSFLWACDTKWEPGSLSDDFFYDALDRRWHDSFLPWAEANHGGISDEGAGYGGCMLRYPVTVFDTCSLYGRDLVDETRWFKEAVYYVIYATAPAPTHHTAGSPDTVWMLNPFGDMEDYAPGGWDLQKVRIGSNYGDFMTFAANHWTNEPAGRYARNWLNMVDPPVTNFLSYSDEGLNQEGRNFGDLPWDYYAPGSSSYLYTRSQWGPDATTVFLQLLTPPGAHHQHEDSGTWQMWRKGRWASRESAGYGFGAGEQVADYSGTGLLDDEYTIAHNGILFGGDGEARYYQRGWGQVLEVETRAEGSHAAVDLTDLYHDNRDDHLYDNQNVGHAEREFVFLRDLEALVIFDRLESTDALMPAEDVTKTFLVHFQSMPVSDQPNSYVSTNGDQTVRVTTLVPSDPWYQVIDEGRQDGQIRLQVNTSGRKQSYFLHVVQGRDASAPDLQIGISEASRAYTVTLLDPASGHGARIVFQKGRTTSGGGFACSPNGVPDDVVPFLDRIEGIQVTDDGPTWELGNFPPRTGPSRGGSADGVPLR